MQYGKKSQENLDTCCVELQQIANKVISYGIYDLSIIEGHRTIERQQELFKEGKTQIDGVNKKGKHNVYPSDALDFLPYPYIVNGQRAWDDPRRFSVIAGLFLAAAKELGYKIRWGGDWDGDGNNLDSRLDDMPHIEIVR